MTECFDLKKSTGALYPCSPTAFVKWFGYVYPALIAAVLVLSLSGCGCGRKKKAQSGTSNPVATTNAVSRMNDKIYLDSLDKHRRDQKVVARDRNELLRKMNVCAERVKAGVAGDVSEEDFKAALEKDEEWQSLKERQAVLDQDVQDVLREARETVRERLIKEERDAKAAGG